MDINFDKFPVGLLVKIFAAIGAVQIAKHATEECDAERHPHANLLLPIGGFFRGIGFAFVESGRVLGKIFGRIIPPPSMRFDPHSVGDGVIVAITGPIFLGLLFAALYEDARRKGELDSSDD